MKTRIEILQNVYGAALTVLGVLWITSVVAIQLAASAYLLPFLWVFYPALLLDGPWASVVLVTSTAVVAGWVLTRKGRLLPFAGALIVGSATLWVGAQSWWALAPSAVALSVPLWMRWRPSLNNDRD